MRKLARIVIILWCQLLISENSFAQDGATWAINPKVGTVFSHNDFRSSVKGIQLLYGPKSWNSPKYEFGAQLFKFSENDLNKDFPKEEYKVQNNIVWLYHDMNVLRLQFGLGMGAIYGKFRDYDKPVEINPTNNSRTYQTKKMGYFNTSLIVGAKLIPTGFVTLGFEFEAMINRFRPMYITWFSIEIGRRKYW